MPNPHVRRDIWSLPVDDPIVTHYARAVEVMQSKPATDPTSWSYQAAIHGTTVLPSQTLWNQCQHGSWYFLPWHRMFLHYFERIVREHIVASGGDPEWALPYWNYGGGTDHNELPLAFRNPTRHDGSPNPLYVAARNPGINSGLGLSPAITSPAAALACTTFTGTSEFGSGIASPAQFNSQTGQLEQTPHNVVHSAIGGLMGDILMAAQDPIFWLHHANIDRIWWLWEHRHREPSDVSWRNQSFSFFEVSGAQASRTCAGVIDTVAQLDYTYDEDEDAIRGHWRLLEAPAHVRWPLPWPLHPEVPKGPVDTGPGPIRHLIGTTDQPLRLIGEPVQITVPIDERAVQNVVAGPAADELQRRAFVDIDNIDAERNPDVVYGVYVNLPPTPSSEDLESHHVGNLSFFGIERARNPLGDEHAHGLHTTVEITSLLDRMSAEGQWQDGHQIDVTFRPITLEAPQDRPELAAEISSPTHVDVPVTVGQVSVRLA
jgi:tyrosinase